MSLKRFNFLYSARVRHPECFPLHRLKLIPEVAESHRYQRSQTIRPNCGDHQFWAQLFGGVSFQQRNI